MRSGSSVTGQGTASPPPRRRPGHRPHRNVSIRLLGSPSVAVDGRTVPGPRGHKTWALLAYLALTSRPVPRAHLAALLFGEANDPLGAMRWTLAELRRGLAGAAEITGDPIVLRLQRGTMLDVAVLEGEPDDEQLHGLHGELLEGISVGQAAFELWLIAERHRISARRGALHREAALRLMANGRPGDAIAFARRAVEDHPFDEGNHVLFVRCLTAAGDSPRALEHVRVCTELFRTELGTEVSAALIEAARATGDPLSGATTIGAASVRTQLEAGRAAISAGAVTAGLECLRRAVDEADRCGDRRLHAVCLMELGTGLVHAVRGGDDEGAIALLRAIELANEVGDRPTSASAHRELGFVEVQAGRRRTADRWLASAEELAGDDGELAAVLGVRGMNASDAADYPTAIGHLERSIERARRCGDERQEAWSSSILGRIHLLRHDDGDAEQCLVRSIGLVHAQRWLAFLPWPRALCGEIELRRGRTGHACATFEEAWTLACQLGDPCWEGMAARGMAIAALTGRDDVGATGWIETARHRCNRVSDRYQWVHAYVLDATVEIATAAGRLEEAQAVNRALNELAARAELRELLARSLAHRAVLGDPLALYAARDIANGIDNPALLAHLDATEETRRPSGGARR